MKWGGNLGIPRDWYPSLSYDRSTGIAHAGGYVGDGAATSNLAGRTLADLIIGRESDRLTFRGCPGSHPGGSPSRCAGWPSTGDGGLRDRGPHGSPQRAAVARRVVLLKGPGPPSDLTWGPVAARPAAARTVELSTTTPGGAPHAAPCGWPSPGTRRTGSHTAAPGRPATSSRIRAFLLHLPDPDEDVLIVEGRLRDLGRPDAVPKAVTAFAGKYTGSDDQAYPPGVGASVDVLFALEPARALSG